jgi:hypothetical protein
MAMNSGTMGAVDPRSIDYEKWLADKQAAIARGEMVSMEMMENPADFSAPVSAPTTPTTTTPITAPTTTTPTATTASTPVDISAWTPGAQESDVFPTASSNLSAPYSTPMSSPIGVAPGRGAFQALPYAAPSFNYSPFSAGGNSSNWTGLNSLNWWNNNSKPV